MREIKKWIFEYWESIVAIIIGISIIISFLWYKIASIPIGFNNREWVIHNNLANRTYNMSYLWHHVAFAPYNIALMIPQYFERYGLFSIRSISAFFGLICVVIFFYITWRWWGTLIAILSAFIFTTSFWFLIVARNDQVNILYVLSALIIILLGFVVRNKKRHETKTLIAALLALTLLYIPGIIWFILAACLLQKKLLIAEFKKLPTQVKIIIPILTLVFLIPLIFYCSTNIANLKLILGFPQYFSIHNILRNSINWFLVIFIRNPITGNYSLGHLPILSIFLDVMFILGAYWIWLKRELNRIYLLGSTLILSWILYSLGGAVTIYLAMPFILCVVATGIAYILQQWFTVFPRNPLARSLGISILVIAVLSVSLFHIDEYYVAWPRTAMTLSDYSTHKP